MTFSIIAHCRETGKIGICIATGSPSVGGRSLFSEANVGALIFQATAEPRLGRLGLDMLRAGHSPQKVIAELVATDPHHSWRQIGVVDCQGRAAACTGTKARDWAGHLIGKEYVVLCNRVTDSSIADAIAEEFCNTGELKFEERLMRSIEAGRDAGGQVDGQTSSAMLTYARLPVAYVDLRVDLSLEPIAELRRVLDWHEPLLDYYVERLSNPELPLHKDWLRERNIDRTFGKVPPKRL